MRDLALQNCLKLLFFCLFLAPFSVSAKNYHQGMTAYEVLGAKPSDSHETIKANFRSLAKENHPDRGGDPEKMRIINEAYDILKDQQKRQQYDRGEIEFLGHRINDQPNRHWGYNQNPESWQEIIHQQYLGLKPVDAGEPIAGLFILFELYPEHFSNLRYDVQKKVAFRAFVQQWLNLNLDPFMLMVVEQGDAVDALRTIWISEKERTSERLQYAQQILNLINSESGHRYMKRFLNLTTEIEDFSFMPKAMRETTAKIIHAQLEDMKRSGAEEKSPDLFDRYRVAYIKLLGFRSIIPCFKLLLTPKSR